MVTQIAYITGEAHTHGMCTSCTNTHFVPYTIHTLHVSHIPLMDCVYLCAPRHSYCIPHSKYMRMFMPHFYYTSIHTSYASTYTMHMYHLHKHTQIHFINMLYFLIKVLQILVSIKT